MASAHPMKRALLAGVAAAMVIPASLGLVGCAAGQAATSGSQPGVEAGIEALHTALTAIGGVEEAQINANTDGSPSQRRLNVVLYVTDTSPAAVTPIVADALRQTWEFDAFTPVGYAIEVWPAPVPEPPVNYDDMFDIETILPELDLAGGYVYDRQLALDAVVLETKYGPRP
ncbi:hypothetical protein E3T55_00105 [Cryobacterium frigoriphilum]|uniref:Uncharacterized protein n=1 Tax=Cryobacterium frigoriphilum TaxID=1259150 RepID=A0A4R9ABR9_9MICO|nr:hypothetical protein [Cryobacterium frigoriphilum]TFD56086.1 hypothetical protein E3T55_00105 [Cryobacterium frigoriphilum]